MESLSLLESLARDAPVDGDWQVRAAAAENLERLGDRAAVPALERAVNDSHAAVRDAVASALGKLRGG